MSNLQHHQPPTEPIATRNDRTNQIWQWCQENPMIAGAGILIVFGLFSGGGNNFSQGAEQRALIQQQAAPIEVGLKIEEQTQDLRADAFNLATQRQQRCLTLVDSQGQAIGIQQNAPVFDSVSGQPLPAGTIVCDRFGWTAELNQYGQMVNLLQGSPDPRLTLAGAQPEPTPAPTPTPKQGTIFVPAPGVSQ